MLAAVTAVGPGRGASLAWWEVVLLYVGLPVLVVAVIAAVVYLTSPRPARTFPRLAPRRSKGHPKRHGRSSVAPTGLGQPEHDRLDGGPPPATRP